MSFERGGFYFDENYEICKGPVMYSTMSSKDNCIQRPYTSIYNIPSCTKRINDSAFVGDKWVKEVKLPIGIERIGYRSFAECQKMVSITFPKTLKEIETLAFHDCSNLRHALLSKTQITEIPENAFSYCFRLSKVTLPKTLIRINDNAFENTKLWHFTLPENLEYIGVKAFSGTEIERIIIPDKVKEINKQTFLMCGCLKSVNLNKVEKIHDFAFANCPKLLHIKLPETLKEIDLSAFVYSGVKELEIPANIQKITFNSKACSDLNLHEITYKGINPDILNYLTEFCKTRRIEFKYCTLDELITAGRSISELNQLYKNLEQEK